MDFLCLLENIRMPVLNEIMLAVTTLGEETAFLVIGLVFFWCVDKKKGYLIMSVGFFGTIITQILKLSFRIPRPWVLDPNFSILEQARDTANGYSFPSGHTQTAVGTFGSIAVSTQKKWMQTVCVILALMVAFSRMYIGVHTPLDVFVGVCCALIFVFLLKRPVLEGERKQMKGTFVCLIAFAVIFLLYVHLWNFPSDMDPHNMESGFKNAYTMLGCCVGIAIVYVCDSEWLNFHVEAKLWIQIIKVVVGLLLVLAVKEGLRAPLDALLPIYSARAIRYFLIVMVAGILWPATFKYLSKIGDKNELRND